MLGDGGCEPKVEQDLTSARFKIPVVGGPSGQGGYNSLKRSINRLNRDISLTANTLPLHRRWESSHPRRMKLPTLFKPQSGIRNRPQGRPLLARLSLRVAPWDLVLAAYPWRACIRTWRYTTCSSWLCVYGSMGYWVACRWEAR